eukprot:904790-Lingulodinium_polyedra.AAC.1
MVFGCCAQFNRFSRHRSMAPEQQFGVEHRRGNGVADHRVGDHGLGGHGLGGHGVGDHGVGDHA